MGIRIVLTGVLNAFSIDSAVYYESKAVLTPYLDLFVTVEQYLDEEVRLWAVTKFQ